MREPTRFRPLLIGAAGAAVGALAVALTADRPAAIAAGALLGAAFAAYPRHARIGGLLAAASVVTLALTTDVGGVPPVSLMVVLHAFCAARWGSTDAAVAVVAASTAGAFMVGDSFVPFLLISAAPGIAGVALRERDKTARQLAERVRELEEEREAHARLSVRYERARIASELLDIVAHAISVMVVQASAGQRLASRDPAGTADAFAAIGDAARRAEEDMGRLVALLGDDSAIADAPDLSLVEEIVARAAGSGLDVTLRLEGMREGLPAEVAGIACRVVQEGLTNALRYAAGAAVSVAVRGGTSALDVAVVNASASSDAALSGTGTGNGLIGLRERIGAVGGTLEAGPTGDGGWRLAARLPRRVPVHPAG